MLFTRPCTRCGCFGIFSDRPINVDNATFTGNVLAVVSRGRVPTNANPPPPRWWVRYQPVGVTPCDGCVYDEAGVPERTDVELGRDLQPEDRIDVVAGKASVTRVVRASVFAGGSAQTNANSLVSALTDAINTIALVKDGDPNMPAIIASMGPFKHPTLSQWAVVLKPKMRVFLTDRAQSLLVRQDGGAFEGVSYPNPFFQTSLAATLTRYNQMCTRLAGFTDLDASWGL